MTPTRRIGILGGMGPEATIWLQQKLLGAVSARDDGDHLPLIIHMNPQVPSRIAHLIEGRGEDPAPVLAHMAKALQNAGAEALAMPCNTAHHYANAIEAAVSVPLLNMVELSAKRAGDSLAGGATVGILASPAMRKTGMFDAALARRGLTALWPADEGKMLAAIRVIKARGPCDEARTIMREASGELAARGATMLLIACTEFSLIADSVVSSVMAIDTLDVLVDAIKAFSLTPTKADFS